MKSLGKDLVCRRQSRNFVLSGYCRCQKRFPALLVMVVPNHSFRATVKHGEALMNACPLLLIQSPYPLDLEVTPSCLV